MTQMKLELLMEKAEGAYDGRTGHVDQRAIAFTAIEVQNLLELIEKGGIAFSLLDAFQYC